MIRRFGRRRRRAAAAAAVAVVTAGAVLADTGGDQRAVAAQPERSTTATGPTVTLVTGDTVTLGGPRGARVDAAAGRADMGFRTWTDAREHTHVVPNDALALVSSGRVDARLFDVTALADAGYDDRSRQDLPLIVDFPGAGARSTVVGATVDGVLSSMGATVLRADRSGDFWSGARDSVERIWLDGPVRANLDHSVPRIGAPEAWDAGHTGADTTVAVLDTGIDENHPDLADAVTAAKDFTDSGSGPADRFGHGTHVASIITGDGAEYRGVAPDATLLNGKVLDDFGLGFESDIIAGMQWAAADRGADVVNMSLGGGPTDGTDPLSRAVNELTEQTGALFVIAAGNDGPSAATVATPGAADAALTVGAVDREDRLAEFSSRGPRVGDGAIKPDITAPGVDVVAARAEGTDIGDPVGDGYVSLSGTSMAAPHVAGAAAIVAGQHPDWSAERLKASLMGSAAPNEELSVFEQGTGRVDVAAATESDVYATPASIDNGVVRWPHDDDQPIITTVTYHNTGDQDVTLDVATEVIGPNGAVAPEGMVTAEPSRVTVPASGTAEVTLTTDTTVDTVDGIYGGVLTATGGDTSVRTPVGVNREVESYDLTIDVVDHNGEPADDYYLGFIGLDEPTKFTPYDDSGTVVARLPKGRYYFETRVGTADGPETLRAEPVFEVAGDSRLTVDARDGEPVEFSVDRDGAESGQALLDFYRTTEWGAGGLWVTGTSFDGLLVTPSTTAAPGEFTFIARNRLAEPDGDGGFTDSPYLYHLEVVEDGRVPATLSWEFADRDLAEVHSVHAASGPDQVAVRDGLVRARLPFSLTEYYTPGQRWSGNLVVDPGTERETFVSRENLRFSAGERVENRWNGAVFGPGFPTPFYMLFPHRFQDEIYVDVPAMSDQHPASYGVDFAASGFTELYLDGDKIGENTNPGFGTFDVGPEPGRYTVRTKQVREGALMSTEVSGEWTFESEHTDDFEPLPLLAVKFAPELDEHNAAPVGTRFEIPVYVQRNQSADPGSVTTPTVRVSYDDGASWETVPVRPRGDRWVATVEHPADAEFVSLRSSVADEDGNSVSQTILRAYALTQ